MYKSLAKVIAAILSKSKTPMVNEEIRAAVYKVRPHVTDAYVDTTLTIAAKKGLINKTPVKGRGRAKFEYSADAVPSVLSVVARTVKVRGTKIDSLETYLAVRSVLPEAKKSAVDSALQLLSKRGEIIKSKTPMTDGNTISSQSKFMYVAA